MKTSRNTRAKLRRQESTTSVDVWRSEVPHPSRRSGTGAGIKNIALYQGRTGLSTYCPTPKDTAQFASWLLRRRPPRLWLLRGNLGSGKTTLVRGALRALGVKSRVTSPTFGLVKIYHLYGQRWRRAAHLDLYRLKHRRELGGIGWPELLGDKKTIVFVEWPAIAGSRIQKPVMRISCLHQKTGRRFTARWS